MKLIFLAEKYFWFMFGLGVVLALIFPYFGTVLKPYTLFLFTAVLFFTFLKMNYADFWACLKKPWMLIYILACYLFVIPTVVYFLAHFLPPALLQAFLLLAAVPPGVAAPTLTEVMKGNVSLSVVLTVLSYLIAPFSMVTVFYILTGTGWHLDLGEMFKTLILIISISFFIAQLVRFWAAKLILKTKKYYGPVNICLISSVIYIVMANQADKIWIDPLKIVVPVLALYGFFIFLQTVSYFLLFKGKKADKVAVAVTKTYMNNALAAVLAFTFFSSEVALIVVLSEIPWSTTIGIFKYFVRDRN